MIDVRPKNGFFFVPLHTTNQRHICVPTYHRDFMKRHLFACLLALPATFASTVTVFNLTPDPSFPTPQVLVIEDAAGKEGVPYPMAMENGTWIARVPVKSNTPYNYLFKSTADEVIAAPGPNDDLCVKVPAEGTSSPIYRKFKTGVNLLQLPVATIGQGNGPNSTCIIADEAAPAVKSAPAMFAFAGVLEKELKAYMKSDTLLTKAIMPDVGALKMTAGEARIVFGAATPEQMPKYTLAYFPDGIMYEVEYSNVTKQVHLKICADGLTWQNGKCVRDPTIATAADVPQNRFKQFPGQKQPTIAELYALAAGKADNETIDVCPGLKYGPVSYHSKTADVTKRTTIACTDVPFDYLLETGVMWVRFYDIFGLRPFFADLHSNWCPPCRWGHKDYVIAATGLAELDIPSFYTIAPNSGEFGFNSNMLYTSKDLEILYHGTRSNNRPGYQRMIGMFPLRRITPYNSGYPNTWVVMSNDPTMTLQKSDYKAVYSGVPPGPSVRHMFTTSKPRDSKEFLVHMGHTETRAAMIVDGILESTPKLPMTKMEIQAAYQLNECCNDDCRIDVAPCWGNLGDTCEKYCRYDADEIGPCDEVEGLQTIEGPEDCARGQQSTSSNRHVISRHKFSQGVGSIPINEWKTFECMANYFDSAWTDVHFNSTQIRSMFYTYEVMNAVVTEKHDDVIGDHITIVVPNNTAHQIALDRYSTEQEDEVETDDFIRQNAGAAYFFSVHEVSQEIHGKDGIVYVKIGLAKGSATNVQVRLGTGLPDSRQYTQPVWLNSTTPKMYEFEVGYSEHTSGNFPIDQIFVLPVTVDAPVVAYKHMTVQGKPYKMQRICKSMTDTCPTLPSQEIPTCSIGEVYISEVATYLEVVEVANSAPNKCSLRGWTFDTYGSSSWGTTGYTFKSSDVVPAATEAGPGIFVPMHSQNIKNEDFYNGNYGRMNVNLCSPIEGEGCDSASTNKYMSMSRNMPLTLARPYSHRNEAFVFQYNSMGWRNYGTDFSNQNYFVLTLPRDDVTGDCYTYQGSKHNEELQVTFRNSNEFDRQSSDLSALPWCTYGALGSEHLATPNHILTMERRPKTLKTAVPIAEGAELWFRYNVAKEVTIKFVFAIDGTMYGTVSQLLQETASGEPASGETASGETASGEAGSGFTEERTEISVDVTLLPHSETSARGIAVPAAIIGKQLTDFHIKIPPATDVRLYHITIVDVKAAIPAPAMPSPPPLPSPPPPFPPPTPANAVLVWTGAGCTAAGFADFTEDDCRSLQFAHYSASGAVLVSPFNQINYRWSTSWRPSGCWMYGSGKVYYNGDMNSKRRCNDYTYNGGCLCKVDPYPSPPPPDVSPPSPPPMTPLDPFTVKVTGSSYASEITWKITCYGVEYASGPPSTETVVVTLPDGQTGEEDCTFEGLDSYGDGWDSGVLTFEGLNPDYVFFRNVDFPWTFTDGDSASFKFSIRTDLSGSAGSASGVIKASHACVSPNEISWTLKCIKNGATVIDIQGDAWYEKNFSWTIGTTCVFTGSDSFGDGWGEGCALDVLGIKTFTVPVGQPSNTGTVFLRPVV